MSVDLPSVQFDPDLFFLKRGKNTLFPMHDFSGTGYLAGEAPNGLSRVDGSPGITTITVNHVGTGVLVGKTTSAMDGTWEVGNLNPSQRYNVVSSKDNYRSSIINDVKPVDTQPPKLVNNPPTLIIVSGQPYEYQLAVRSGDTLQVSHVSGSFPTGISLTGQAISGTTISSANTYNATLELEDEVGQTSQVQVVIKTFVVPLKILFDKSKSLPSLLPKDELIAPITLRAQGGVGPYTFTQTGTLPAGLTFTDNGNGTATLSGTPDTAATYSWSVTVEDGFSSTVVVEFETEVRTPVAHWRLLIESNIEGSANYSVVGHWQMGGETASGGTLTYDSQYDGYTWAASNAISGSSYGWHSANAALPHWIAYEYSQAKMFSSVKIRSTSYNSNLLRSPKNFKIQNSSDGTTWNDVLVVTNEPAWGLSETRTYYF